MTRIKLTPSEVNIIRKIARRSKMDCWLNVCDDGTITDLEDEGKKMSVRTAMRCMVKGMTPYDVETLTPDEIVSLAELLQRI
jgi:hypothetical protein